MNTQNFSFMGKNCKILSDPKLRMEWHTQLIHGIKSEKRVIPEHLLYWGPGLAKNWFNLIIDNPVYDENFKLFEEHCIPMLENWKGNGSAVLDLGAGDLVKGQRVLKYLLNRGDSGLRYIPMDISLEMLKLGLSESFPKIDREFWAYFFQQQGSIECINADFSDLKSLRPLYSNGKEKLILFLGNTLTAVPDPAATLLNIREAMDKSDRLLIESQIIEAIPSTHADLNKGAKHLGYFYGGSFTAIGYLPDQLDFSAEIVDASTDPSAKNPPNDLIAYNIFCHTKIPKIFSFPEAFEKPIEIPAERFQVFCIRKFKDFASARLLLERCGFEIVAEKEVKGPAPKIRRFPFFMVKKK